MNEEEDAVYKPKAAKQSEEDREDTAYSQQASDLSSQPSSAYNSGAGSESQSNDDIINITSCDFPQFAEYMSKQYGTAAFKQGFQIVQSQQDLMYAVDGEDRLLQLLKPHFSDEDSARGFINFCTTYLIVQNMNFN